MLLFSLSNSLHSWVPHLWFICSFPWCSCDRLSIFQSLLVPQHHQHHAWWLHHCFSSCSCRPGSPVPSPGLQHWGSSCGTHTWVALGGQKHVGIRNKFQEELKCSFGLCGYWLYTKNDDKPPCETEYKLQLVSWKAVFCPSVLSSAVWGLSSVLPSLQTATSIPWMSLALCASLWALLERTLNCLGCIFALHEVWHWSSC